jgi:hypothetical protein
VHERSGSIAGSTCAPVRQLKERDMLLQGLAVEDARATAPAALPPRVPLALQRP